ncbi:MFS transporter [Cytophagaceae bacterium YF14B1]|uniref:MFS transporter n=1 Tax=Xanthocytophaga flava TaxID=3048013 RepID=A0AAE3UC33_9BACT|nr:MFS transporter [Xanthocytophaga flavus]MDJ1484354.1 MFS transporter [Xanthocytophaga flavus]
MQTITSSQSTVSLRNALAFGLCLVCYLLGGTVSTLLSVYLPVAIPELLQTSVSEAEMGRIGAYLNSAFIYGWMLGGLTLGIVSDRVGRLKTLAFSTGLYGLFTLCIVFISDWHILLACRFIAGIGVGGVLLISTVYIAEIWDEKTRPIALGILAVAFPVGIILAGILNVQIPYWKHAFWLGVLPVALSLVLPVVLSEPAQWKDARKTKAVDMQTIFSPEYRRNLLIGGLIFGSVLIGLWAVFSWVPTWVQSLLSNTSDGQKERGTVMMLFGMGGIIGGIVSGFLIRAMGTRYTLLFTFSGCIVACIALFMNKQFSPVIYIETAVLALFFGISQGTLSSYIPALFPTSIRATATGFCFNIGRFFTATAVFFVGNLVSVVGGFNNALLLFSSTFIIAWIVAFYNREANEKTPE